MGRELKQVFPDERTDKIMQQAYIAFEGYELSKQGGLTEGDWKTLVEHLWKTCEILMRVGDIWEFFEKYCSIQQEEDDGGDKVDANLKKET